MAVQPTRPQAAEMHLLRPRAGGVFAREVQVATDGPGGLVRDSSGALWTTAGNGASLRRLPAGGGPADEYRADDRTRIADFLLDPEHGRTYVRTAFEVASLGEDLSERGRLSFGGFGFQRRMDLDEGGLAVLDEDRLVRLDPEAAVREQQDLGFRAGSLVPVGEGRFLASDGHPGHLALAEPGGVTRLSDAAFENSATARDGRVAWVEGQVPRGAPRTLSLLDVGDREVREAPGDAGARSAVALPGGRTLLYREFILEPSLSLFDRDGQELVRHSLGDAAMVRDFLMDPEGTRAWAVAQRRETGGDRMVQALLEFDLAGAEPMKVLHESSDDFLPAPLKDGGFLLFARDGVTRLDAHGRPSGEWSGPAEMLRGLKDLPEVGAEQVRLGSLAFGDARRSLGSFLAEAQRRYRYGEEAWLPVGPGREISTASGILRSSDEVEGSAAAPLLGLAGVAEALRMGLMSGLAEGLVLASRLPVPGGAGAFLEVGERELALHRPGEEGSAGPGIRLQGDRFTSVLPFTAGSRPYAVAATRAGKVFLWDLGREAGGAERFDAGEAVRSLQLTDQGVVFTTEGGALGVVRLPGRAPDLASVEDPAPRKDIVAEEQRVRVGDVELPVAAG